MKLQKLLLKLSYRKDISVECHCINGFLNITLKEWYTFREILSVSIKLTRPIDKVILDQLHSYIN